MKYTYDRVIFTGDFLRFFPNQNGFEHKTHQHSNITWLYDLLSEQLKEATGLPVEYITWDPAEPKVNVLELFNASGHTPDLNGWVRTYNRTNPSQEEINIISETFGGSLVIGFELSPYLRSTLSENRIPFISLAFSPVRFSHDLFFNIKTNIDYAHKKMQNDTWKRNDFKKIASFVKATRKRAEIPELQEKSALFVGQVGIDASRISGQRTVSLDEYFEEITEIHDTHNMLYVKRHPYGKFENSSLDFFDQLKNVSFVGHEIYSLLSTPKIETVASISSSVLFESQFFDKKIIRLLKNDFDIGDGSKETFIGKKILETKFWTKILNLPTQKSRDVFQDIRSPISEALKSDWKTPSYKRDNMTLKRFDPLETISWAIGGNAEGDIANPEEWGVWVQSPVTNFKFRTFPMENKKVHIDFNIVLPGPDGQKREMHFKKGKKLIKTALVSEKNSTVRVDFDDKNIDDFSTFDFSIHCDDFFTPSAEKISNDNRQLYFGISSARIIPEANRLPISSYKNNISLTSEGARIIRHGETNIPISTITPKPQKIELYFPIKPISDIQICLQNVSEPNHGDKIVVRSCDGAELITSTSHPRIRIPRGWITERGIFDFEIFHQTKDASPDTETENSGVHFTSMSIEPFTLSSPSVQSGVPPKISVIGQIRINTGLGVHTRNTVGALIKCFGPERVNVLNIDHSNHIEANNEMDRLINSDLNPISIFCVAPQIIDRAYKAGHKKLIESTYNICLGAWELPRLPSSIAQPDLLQEYWGVSDFVSDAARISGMPNVSTQHLAVKLDTGAKFKTRADFNLPQNKFIFLFTFCADSTMIRKNPEACIEAFQKAFPDSSTPVELVFKCKMTTKNPENVAAFETFKEYVDADPRIHIILENMDMHSVLSLYTAADAYISLHRSEGFGLTMAEAMLLGVPTIATGFSGNIDFMNTRNSAIVDYELTTDGTEKYHNQQGQTWANPDVDHAASLMQKVYNDDQYRTRLSTMGQLDIEKNFSISAISKQLAEKINRIEKELS